MGCNTLNRIICKNLFLLLIFSNISSVFSQNNKIYFEQVGYCINGNVTFCSVFFDEHDSVPFIFNGGHNLELFECKLDERSFVFFDSIILTSLNKYEIFTDSLDFRQEWGARSWTTDFQAPSYLILYFNEKNQIIKRFLIFGLDNVNTFFSDVLKNESKSILSESLKVFVAYEKEYLANCSK